MCQADLHALQASLTFALFLLVVSYNHSDCNSCLFTVQLEVNETVYQAGLGGATTKAVEESFKVQVLYLSDELRIVEVSGDEDDEVRGAGG